MTLHDELKLLDDIQKAVGDNPELFGKIVNACTAGVRRLATSHAERAADFETVAVAYAALATDKLVRQSALLSLQEKVRELEARLRSEREMGKWLEEELYHYRTAPVQTSAKPVATGHNPPYSNCQYQICDLPGQCRGEGACRHPKTGERSESEDRRDAERYRVCRKLIKDFAPYQIDEKLTAAEELIEVLRYVRNVLPNDRWADDIKKMIDAAVAAEKGTEPR